jgi:hypothetical protein
MEYAAHRYINLDYRTERRPWRTSSCAPVVLVSWGSVIRAAPTRLLSILTYFFPAFTRWADVLCRPSGTPENPGVTTTTGQPYPSWGTNSASENRKT